MTYNYFLIFLSISLLSSCQLKTPGSFYETYSQAKLANKYLWLNIGYGNDLGIKHEIQQYCESEKELKDKVILQQYNLLDTSHIFLNYIFLIENVNNSYIFDPHGKIISFSFNKITAESIREQLTHAIEGQSTYPKKIREFASFPDSLMLLYNFMLNAHLLYTRHASCNDSLNKALYLLNHSIEIEPYFYNLYLKSKILKIQKDPDATNYAQLAIQYIKSEYQQQIYAHLTKELFTEFPNSIQSKGHGILNFKETVLDAGKIPLNTEHEFQFEFENTGAEPVIITFASSSCGCATPEWDREPILPHEKGIIKVTFHAEKSGNFVRSILVQSTAQNNVEQLLLRGHVPLPEPRMKSQ